jgi:hypothetical protein
VEILALDVARRSIRDGSREEFSGGAAVLGGDFYRLLFHSISPIPRKQPLKIVAVGTVAAEGILIEQALDSAARTNLVGTTLGSDGPAHLPVPATPQEKRRARQPSGQQRPEPTPTRRFRGFRFFLHYQPERALPLSEYDVSGRRAIGFRHMHYSAHPDWHPSRLSGYSDFRVPLIVATR